MLGLFDTPEESTARRFVFGPTGVLGSSDFQAWSKGRARGCSMLHVLCIGSGGGGGGGVASNTGGGDSRGGAAGGSSGAITRGLFPLALLPEVLYIAVGYGGTGGPGGAGIANGTVGVNGRHSRVAIYPNTDPANLLVISSNVAALGGPPGQSNASVLGAVAAGAADAIFGGWGIITSLGGLPSQAGGNGVTPGPFGGVSGPLLGIIQPGCGGAGCVASGLVGGSYPAWLNTAYPAIAGGAAGGKGNPGFRFNGLIYGGTGGGSSNVGNGGDGGDCGPDAFGAGGGGGGAGLALGGRGGNGGPGLVIFTCW